MNNHTFAVCAYKQSPYLEECIKSLLAQTLKSRIIISTSTPNDYISGIAKKYNLEVFSHDNGGIANDWNFAFKASNTKYCTLAHQDDIYQPEYLEKCLELLKIRDDSLIAFTHYKEIKDGRITEDNVNLRIKKSMLLPLLIFKNSRFIRRRILSFGSTICCPSVTYNLHALRDFRFDSSLTVSLDWDAWERISKIKGSFLYINSPLVLHRIHEQSETTNAITDNRRSNEDMLMLRRFWNENLAIFVFKLYSKSQDSNY